MKDVTVGNTSVPN